MVVSASVLAGVSGTVAFSSLVVSSAEGDLGFSCGSPAGVSAESAAVERVSYKKTGRRSKDDVE